MAQKKSTSNQTARQCTACGGKNVEQMDQFIEGDRVFVVYACNDCYAGWEVQYEAVKKSQTTEPQK